MKKYFFILIFCLGIFSLSNSCQVKQTADKHSQNASGPLVLPREPNSQLVDNQTVPPNSDLEDPLDEETNILPSSPPFMPHMFYHPATSLGGETQGIFGTYHSEHSDYSYVLKSKTLQILDDHQKIISEIVFSHLPVNSPVINEKGLFIQDQAGYLQRFDLDGKFIWKRNDITSAFLNPPVLANETTLIANEQGTEIFGLDVQTGAKKWVFNANTFVNQQVSIGPKGKIYLATPPGQLYVIDPDTGKSKLIFLTEGRLPDSSPALDAEGKIYLVTLSGTLHAIDANGFSSWQFRVPEPFDYGAFTSPDGQVYMVSRAGRLYAFETHRGHLNWHLTLPDTISHSLLIGTDGTIYAILRSQQVMAVNAQGETLWLQSLPADFKTQHVQFDTQGRLLLQSVRGDSVMLTIQSPELWRAKFRKGA